MHMRNEREYILYNNPTFFFFWEGEGRYIVIISKGAKIRNRYHQVPHLTQDTNGKVTNSQLDTTNNCQEVSPFSTGYRNAQIYRRAQRHNKHQTETRGPSGPKALT